MNEMNEPTERASTEAAANAHAIRKREDMMRKDCGRLLRRELGYYFEDENELRAFRIASAMDELRRIHAELDTMLDQVILRN